MRRTRSWVKASAENIHRAGAGQDALLEAGAVLEVEQVLRTEFQGVSGAIGTYFECVERSREAHLREFVVDGVCHDAHGRRRNSAARALAAVKEQREQAESARRVAEGEAVEAKRRLDAADEGRIVDDFVARWSHQVSMAAAGARAADAALEHSRQWSSAAREGAAQNGDGESDDETAVRTSAVQRQVDEAGARAEALRVEAALRHAETHQLVPVKLRISGMRMAHIADKDKFSQALAESFRKALDLEDCQLTVKGIRGGVVR